MCSNVNQGESRGRTMFQVLGACAIRGIHPDKVVAGTIFSVLTSPGQLYIHRDNGRRVGLLHREAVEQYNALPPNRKYDKVVVARDVDLNDKYGQCFVYPLYDNDIDGNV